MARDEFAVPGGPKAGRLRLVRPEQAAQLIAPLQQPGGLLLTVPEALLGGGGLLPDGIELGGQPRPAP